MKKIILSFLLVSGITIPSNATTYYLQEASLLDAIGILLGGGFQDLNNRFEWNTSPIGLGTVPTNFNNASDVFDMQGVNGILTGDWTLAGTLINSGSAATIYANDRGLAAGGIGVDVYNITFSNAQSFSDITLGSTDGGGTITYGSAGDILPGWHSELAIASDGTYTATGNITINNNLSLDAAVSTGELDLSTYTLSDGGSFAYNPDSPAQDFTLSTTNTSSAPFPEATWTAGFTANFEGSSNQYIPSGTYGNITCSGSGLRYIAASSKVEITDGLNSSRTIVLEASESSTAQLKAANANTGGGSFTKEFYLDLSSPRYYLLGTAVTGGDLTDLNDGGATMNFSDGSTGSAWRWDAENAEWAVASSTGNSATEGNYIYAGTVSGTDFLRSGSGIVDITGTGIATSDQDIGLGYHTGAGSSVTFVGGTSQSFEEGWNLIANPYLSDIDWEQITIPANMNNAYYVWNGSSYDSYVHGVGGSAGQYIASGQAFFVQATTTGITLTLASDARTTTQGKTLAKGKTSFFCELGISENLEFNRSKVIVHMNDDATTGFDGAYDAHYFHGSPSAPQIAAVTPGGLQSVAGVPREVNSVQLKFLPVAGVTQYTIDFSEVNNDFNRAAYLLDQAANTYTRMEEGGYYTFSSTGADTPSDRFSIVFQSTVGTEEISSVDLFWTITENEIIVHSTSSIQRGQLCSINGAVLTTAEEEDNELHFDRSHCPSGMYLLQFIDTDGKVRSEKLIL